MPNRHYADRLVILGELVDDAERPDPQGAKTPQSPAERVADQWVAFKQPERVLYRNDEGPVELKQLTSGAPCEDDTCHRLLSRATGVELSTKVRKCDGLVARELSKTGLDRGQRLGIGQDLRRLLQGVVLIDRNQRSGRFAVAGN